MVLIEASARNQAAWADWQIRAHGLDCRWSDTLWTCWESAPGTEIHPQAITLTQGSPAEITQMHREIEALAGVLPTGDLSVLDWWSALDLRPLGFSLVWDTAVEPAPYLVRPPAEFPAGMGPPDLAVSQVNTAAELVEFEDVSFEGYSASGKRWPGRWHAQASLHDAGNRYLLGRVDGRPVAASIGVASDGVLGIYGVATIPEFRRRGYGTAMTWAALSLAPDLPAVLGPSEMAEPLYRKMGFADFHGFRMWRRR